jgi:WD40 repeat protein
MIAFLSMTYPIILQSTTDDELSTQIYCTKENAHGVTDVNVAVWCPLDEYGDLLATGGDDGIIRLWKLKE